jgi:hypothetical protein
MYCERLSMSWSESVAATLAMLPPSLVRRLALKSSSYSGAQAQPKDDRGKTALDIARDGNFPATAKLLEAAARKLTALIAPRVEEPIAPRCEPRPDAAKRPVVVDQRVLEAAGQMQHQGARQHPAVAAVNQAHRVLDRGVG